MGVSADKPGWPREYIPRNTGAPYRPGSDTVKTPALYVGGNKQHEGDWLTFDPENAEKCRTNYLCVACGLPLGRTVVLGHMNPRVTDGPPCHPRCFALALKFCPRFSQAPYTRSKQTVAYVYDGDDRFGWASRARRDDLESSVNLKGANVWGEIQLSNKVRAMKRPAAIELAKTNPMGAVR